MADDANKKDPFDEDQLIVRSLVEGDGPFALIRAYDQATQQLTSLICVGVATPQGLYYQPVAQTIPHTQLSRYVPLQSATLH